MTATVPDITANIETSQKSKLTLNPSLLEETLSLVGTSYKGPAFVPTQVLSYSTSNDTLNTFENIFGLEDKNISDASTAALFWMENGGGQLSFTRILGIGSNSAADPTTGLYAESGFVVGDKPIKYSVVQNKKGDNKRACRDNLGAGSLKLGRTFFYCELYENRINNKIISSSNDLIKQFGSSLLHSDKCYFLTKVFMTTQGTVLSLNKYSKTESILSQELIDKMSNLTVKSDFVNTSNDLSVTSNSNIDDKILIAGLDNTEYLSVSNKITFKENSECYRINLQYDTSPHINRRLKYYYEKGYVEYANFSCYDAYYKKHTDEYKLLSHSKSNHNTLEDNIPNYEDFQSIYTTAETPWIVSQPVNRSNISEDRENIQDKVIDLFKFISLDDGEIGNRFRIRIKPKKINKDASIALEKHKNTLSFDKLWATFDVKVSEYMPESGMLVDALYYSDVNLNKNSKNYICRVFGTERTYWDKKTDNVITSGYYKQTNNYLVVKVHEDIENGNILPTIIPAGFRAYPHIDIKLSDLKHTDSVVNDSYLHHSDTNYYDLIQKPIDMVQNLRVTKFKDNMYQDLSSKTLHYWGVLFDKPTILLRNYTLDVKTTTPDTINFSKDAVELVKYSDYDLKNYYLPSFEYSKFFQNTRKDKNVWKQDDSYCNSFFHLEKILYIQKGKSQKDKWLFSHYRRDGLSVEGIKSGISDNAIKVLYDNFSYVNIEDALTIAGNENESINSEYLKFDLFTYGGFDGVNCLEYDKKLINADAVIRELEDEDGDVETVGPSYTSYNKGMTLSAEYSNTNADILCLPGITHKTVINQLISLADDKKKFIVVYDIPGFDSNGDYIVGQCFDESFTDNEYDTDSVRGDIVSVKYDNKTLREVYTENTSSTIFFAKRKINNQSRYSLPVYNSILSINEISSPNIFYPHSNFKTKFLIPGSILAIRNLGYTKSNININIDNTETMSAISPYVISSCIDYNFIHNSNDLLHYYDLSQQSSINTIGIRNNSDSINAIRLNSSNSGVANKNSLFRTINNTRIITLLKKSIRIGLLTNININNQAVLFNNNSQLSQIDTKVNLILDNILTEYKNKNYIKNYFINLNTDSNNIRDRVNNKYLFNTEVALELYSSIDTNTKYQSLELSNILNNLTDSIDTDIIVSTL